MQKLQKYLAGRDLKRQVSRDRIHSDLITRYAYARDAGFYRLLPQLVVKAQAVEEIAAIFHFAFKTGRSIVFRAGGTSLSGQSISDDILVEVKQGWRDLKILDEGKCIQLQPGVVAATANRHLESFGYRVGPDPGSIRSALIGGIVANNASGIGSGIRYNSYHTLVNMEMVLPGGLILNTANPQEDEKFQSQAPELFEGLIRLRERIRNDDELVQRIRNKYKLKNTMGYSLNSFLDYDKPVDILAHLMVGSEGTLGFISQVTLNTVPLRQHKATSLILLPTLTDAARLVPKLKKAGSSALEIMDDAALRAISHLPGLPSAMYTIIPEGSSALLIEYEANTSRKLNTMVEAAVQIISEKHPSLLPQFFSDPLQRERLWKVRRELGPLHAATRPPETTVLSEDVCFQTKDLARAIKDLKVLFRRYKYTDAVIFGHAGDGNLHFKLSLDLSDPDNLKKYSSFMEDLAEIVIVKYDGSLKAEHGTGRNMAPFVQREWGASAYKIMHEIKQLLDPHGILNPNVLLSDDDQIHLKHIKPIPQVADEVDKCIECGLCEPICPSEDYTFTPRQRIAVLREIEGLRETWQHEKTVKKLERAYKFHAIDTCAIDGLCTESCPVGIDTGLLMKRFRHESRGVFSKHFHRLTQKKLSWTLLSVKAILKVLASVRFLLKYPVAQRSMNRVARMTNGRIPALNLQLQASRGKLPTAEKEADVVYFPSCLTRSLASPSQKDLPVDQAFVEILKQAGIRFQYPDNVTNLCCGLSFSSKGYSEAALQSAIQTTEALWNASQGGCLPIVMDTSPCTSHLKNYDQILSGIQLAHWRALKIVDIVEYLHDEVLTKLSLWHVQEQIVLHPTCSTQRMGLTDKMEAIARRCAKEVIIPNDWGCCAFAGDRGLLIPELTASATVNESQEVANIQADGHYSTSRTCEIGMTLATDKSYQSIIYLVHKAMIQTSD